MKSEYLLTRNLSEGKISLTLEYPTDRALNQVFSLITKILAERDRGYLADTIITSVRELILNGVKANLKRILFKKKGLNINIEQDYKKGMDIFREIATNYSHLKSDLTDSGYTITVEISGKDRSIIIAITNNSGITDDELDAINERISAARDSENFNEVYSKVFNPAEGAGLGIALTILLLKRAGIQMENFSVKSAGNNVTAEIIIPYDLRQSAVNSSVKEMILGQIGALPTFPAHITELKRMCLDPNASIDEITRRISVDPSLTADILRLANSAGFITSRKIDLISEAVMIIGLKNLYALLLAAAARGIMNQRYKKFEKIWEHSNRAAFYARMIAEERGFAKLSTAAFTAGLLHALGKIILLSVDPSTSKSIARMMKEKDIAASDILEEIHIGISHSEIGSEIAKKWNFPDYLTETIRYHNNPSASSEEFRDITIIVYVANILCGIETSKRLMSHIELSISEKLGFNSADMISEYHERLKDGYNRQRRLL